MMRLCRMSEGRRGNEFPHDNREKGAPPNAFLFDQLVVLKIGVDRFVSITKPIECRQLCSLLYPSLETAMMSVLLAARSRHRHSPILS